MITPSWDSRRRVSNVQHQPSPGLSKRKRPSSITLIKLFGGGQDLSISDHDDDDNNYEEDDRPSKSKEKGRAMKRHTRNRLIIKPPENRYVVITFFLKFSFFKIDYDNLSFVCFHYLSCIPHVSSQSPAPARLLSPEIHLPPISMMRIRKSGLGIAKPSLNKRTTTTSTSSLARHSTSQWI